MSFRLGCAIWAYKEWVGDLFPSGSRASEFLSLYSRRLNTVEGNTTFYSVPDSATVQRWASETPEDFRFCLKLPRDVTHGGLLTPAISGAIDFLDRMQGLGTRLGPLFAQLPPSYSPAQMDDLVNFLQAFPRDRASLALEVRHADWFKPTHADRLNQVLQELGMGRVLLDTRPIYECEDNPQLYSERRKPQVPLQPIVTANFTLIRYISHPDKSLNRPYLEQWVKLVDRWLKQSTEIYFFVHCPVEKQSPQNLRYFQHLLEQQQVDVPPLLLQDEPPTQLSLF